MWLSILQKSKKEQEISQNAAVQRLADEDVQQLQHHFRQRFLARAARVVDSQADEGITHVLADVLYLHALRRKRPLSDGYWRRIIDQRGRPFLETLLSKGDRKKQDMSPLLSRLVKEAEISRSVDQHLDHVFQGKDRIYVRPCRIPSSVEKAVAAGLAAQGMKIHDYAAGLAASADGKKIMRIGKALQPQPEVLDRYKKDPSRAGGGLLVVFSRRADDIARMSVRRGWTSCMNPRAFNSVANWRIPTEISHGGLVAYLISDKDPEIANPLARISIKAYQPMRRSPLVEAALKHVFRYASTAALGPPRRLYVPSKPYGLGNDGFTETVRLFCEDVLNVGLRGRYVLPVGVIHDGLYVIAERRDGVTRADYLIR
jgi:hypothetical protein